VVTQNILAQGGGIGDFLGDAALGFWGWPVASPTAPLDACRAALGIRRMFQERLRDSQDPLSDFRVGIGIAQGRAVAGKIGTSDHVKVTVFGPVVNLASRLEGLTKQLHVPILLDEGVAKQVREQLPREIGRIRSIARVLPSGLSTPLTVSELLPPAGPDSPLSDTDLANFERAVEAFVAGRWEEAYHSLHAIPPTDQAQDFMALQIAQNHRQPPADWNGVISLPSK
jgi:adenylate cyclase